MLKNVIMSDTQHYIGVCLDGLRKSRKQVYVISIQAEILTWNLHNTYHQHYCFDLLGEVTNRQQSSAQGILKCSSVEKFHGAVVWVRACQIQPTPVWAYVA
jgi:hypothetical protein